MCLNILDCVLQLACGHLTCLPSILLLYFIDLHRLEANWYANLS